MNSKDGNKSARDRRLDEVVTAYLKDIDAGRAPNLPEWLARYPDLADDLAVFLAAQDQVDHLVAPLRAPVAPTGPVPVERMSGRLEDAVTQGLTPGVTVSTAPLGTVRYFGDYELLEEIARGGMGVVYKARQVKLQRIVAVKMILAGELANQTDVERFHVEARAAANLHHPHIVAIHEVGQHNGQHYFSMDYVAGESLATRIARRPLPAREAATLLAKAAQAVSFAHGAGVIHRDLKPANILLDAKSEPHVTDFGLAKRVQAEPGALATEADLTQTGQVLGTPSYMPPEQAAGRTKDIGPGADVYSLGAVLYCALTGRPPFQAASTLDTLLQVLDREPVSPRALDSAVPRDLDTICLKCLEKDPGRRYASAEELVDELQRFVDGKPILARPVGSAERTWRWCRRNPVVAGLTAALVVAMVTGTVISALFGFRAEQAAIVSAGLAEKAKELAIQEKDAADRATKEAERATKQERLTRRYLYSAHMNLAHQAYRNGNMLRVVELLNQHRPQEEQDDLRSFDWRHLWWLCHRQQRTIPLANAPKPPWANTVNSQGGVAVTAFVISPNGRWIAVGIMGNSDRMCGEVRLLDITTGTLRKTFVGDVDKALVGYGPDRQFQDLVFSADSKLFAMVTWDYPMVLKEDATFKSRSRELQTPRLTVWDVDTMTLRTTIPLSSFQEFDRIAISPRRVAASFLEGVQSAVMVWDLPDFPPGDKEKGVEVGPEKIFRLPPGGGGDRGFYCFTFTEDGKSLAWANRGGGKFTLTNVSGEGHDLFLQIPAYSLAYSPDGKYFANLHNQPGTLPPVVMLRDAATAKEIHTFQVPATHRYLEMTLIRFSPDSRILALARGQGLELLDVESKKQIGDIRGHAFDIRAIGFGADSKTIITVSGNNEAKVWDVGTRPGPEEFALGKGPRGQHPVHKKEIDYTTISAQAIAPDGKTLATVWGWQPDYADQSGVLVLSDLSPGSFGKQLGELKSDTPKDFLPHRVHFSRDGKWLAMNGVGLAQNNLRTNHFQLWKLAPSAKAINATLERTLYAPQNFSFPAYTRSAAFSPDGTKFAYTELKWSLTEQTNTDRIQVHDLATGAAKQLPADTASWFPHAQGLAQPFKHWESGACSGSSVVFSADGKRVFTGQRLGTLPWPTWIIAWDTATGNAVAVLEASRSLAQAAPVLALSPDDGTLASCHDDHSIQLWDVREPTLREVLAKQKQLAEEVGSGKGKSPTEPAARPMATLRGHSDVITAITFHPDGKILASASLDRTIKLWDAVTGELRLTLEGHAANITTIAFTPDGNTLISCDAGGAVKLWRSTTDQ